jgi:glycosyltransferase involved in cell wall biosynthesis
MQKRVLIAHVPYEHRGGEDVHVETLAEAYSRIGVTPLLYPSDRSPVKHSLASVGASLKLQRVPQDFLDLWKNEKPDFVHVHNAFPVLGPGFFSWSMKERIPLVMTVHNHRFYCTNGLALRDGRVCKDCLGGMSPWKPVAYNCNSNLAKSTYHALALNKMRSHRLYEQAVTKYIAPSPYIRDELIRFGVDANSVHLLMNPVDIPAEKIQSEVRDFRWDVIYAGRLSKEKGLRQLMQAFRNLPDLSLAIAGDGPERSWMQEQVRDMPNVKLLGTLSRDELLREVQSARIGVLPSICNEILPTFVLECFALGRRCVLSDQESTRWLSGEGYLGITAPIGDPLQFSKQIRAALTLPLPALELSSRLRAQLGLDRFCSELADFVKQF